MDEWLAGRELDEPIVVYRVMTKDAFEGHVTDGVYHDDGYTATSCLFDAVSDADPVENIWLEIEVPVGKGNGAYIDGVSSHEGGEFEYLIRRGADFDIIEEQRDDEGRMVYRAVMR